MLVLAVHSVAQVTAKVAFSTILLQDFITNGKTPADFKCRQLIPTSGAKSISLWDVTDPEALLAWLNENVNVDCDHEVFEVQEEFGLGLLEVQRARAADRVTAGTKDVGKAIGAAATDIDHRLRLSERAGHVGTAVRDSTVVQTTAAAFTKAGSSMKSATTKVFEQPAVASATEAMGSGFKKMGAGLSSFTSKMTRKNSIGSTTTTTTTPIGEVDNPDDFGELPRASPPSTTAAPAPATLSP